MGQIKKITSDRVQQIRDIIDNTYFIEGRPDSRVEKLRKLGYVIRKATLRPVSCPVGKLHHYTKELRFQIGSKTGYYAWCVIFDPTLSWEEVYKINLETFSGFNI